MTFTTRVHCQPSASGYLNVAELPRSETLVPHLVPPLAVRLADLSAG